MAPGGVETSVFQSASVDFSPTPFVTPKAHRVPSANRRYILSNIGCTDAQGRLPLQIPLFSQVPCHGHQKFAYARQCHPSLDSWLKSFYDNIAEFEKSHLMSRTSGLCFNYKSDTWFSYASPPSGHPKQERRVNLWPLKRITMWGSRATWLHLMPNLLPSIHLPSGCFLRGNLSTKYLGCYRKKHMV